MLSQAADLGEVFDLHSLRGCVLYCESCAEAHRFQASDEAPSYDASGGSQPRDDGADFLNHHDGHDLRVLARSGEAELRSHARWDPMCQVTWEAVDSVGCRWLVTYGRRCVSEARTYRVRPGRLSASLDEVRLATEVLEDVLEEAFLTARPSASAVADFVARASAAVAAIPADGCEVIDEDRSDPEVQLALLPPAVLPELRASASEIFAQDVVNAVLEGIDDLAQVIPAVRLRRHYEIEAPTH